jgi:Fur family ferric uptake transcriptional regulator
MEHGPPRNRNRTWDEELRSRGYRVTPQRQLVLEAVARLDHATPEAIAASVQQTVKGVNISTSDAGHVHLVCQGCGKIDEADQEMIAPLTRALDTEHGFETNVSHLTIFGRCAECRSKSDA